MVKNLPANAGDAEDVGSIPGSGKSPGEGNRPTPVFLPGKSQGQRSQAGYSPWGHKELDMTEQVNMHRYHCWVETALLHAYFLVLGSVAGF